MGELNEANLNNLTSNIEDNLQSIRDGLNNIEDEDTKESIESFLSKQDPLVNLLARLKYNATKYHIDELTEFINDIKGDFEEMAEYDIPPKILLQMQEIMNEVKRFSGKMTKEYEKKIAMGKKIQKKYEDASQDLIEMLNDIRTAGTTSDESEEMIEHLGEYQKNADDLLSTDPIADDALQILMNIEAKIIELIIKIKSNLPKMYETKLASIKKQKFELIRILKKNEDKVDQKKFDKSLKDLLKKIGELELTNNQKAMFKKIKKSMKKTKYLHDKVKSAGIEAFTKLEMDILQENYKIIGHHLLEFYEEQIPDEISEFFDAVQEAIKKWKFTIDFWLEVK